MSIDDEPQTTSRSANGGLRQDIRDLTREINGQAKLMAGLIQQVSSLVEATSDLKQAISHVTGRTESVERDLLGLMARVSGVEKAQDRPLLTIDELAEIRRMLALAKARGVVDVLSQEEQNEIRSLLRSLPHRDDRTILLANTVSALDEWHHVVDQKFTQSEGRIATVDQHAQDLTQRVNAQRENLNDVSARLAERETMHHLEDDELGRVRTLLSDYERDRTETRARWQTVRANLTGNLIWYVCVSPLTIVGSILLSRLIHP